MSRKWCPITNPSARPNSLEDKWPFLEMSMHITYASQAAMSGTFPPPFGTGRYAPTHRSPRSDARSGCRVPPSARTGSSPHNTHVRPGIRERLREFERHELQCRGKIQLATRTDHAGADGKGIVRQDGWQHDSGIVRC